MVGLADQACIVGVGETAYTRGSHKSVLRLVLEASTNAIADAGLSTCDIDGFVLSAHYVNQEQWAAYLGIEDLHYSTSVYMGGASPAAQSAALAVTMGGHQCVDSVWLERLF
jgi:3-oxoacyl-[acyl-carrier-protein] synthase III